MFQDNFAHLQHTIQAPEDVASSLFSRGIIDPETRDKIQLSMLTTSKKCEELLKAIKHRISATPSVFYEFTSEEPTTERLAYKLVRDVSSKLASKVLHSLCTAPNELYMLYRTSTKCAVSNTFMEEIWKVWYVSILHVHFGHLHS